jgi:hypothetical protein
MDMEEVESVEEGKEVFIAEPTGLAGGVRKICCR